MNVALKAPLTVDKYLARADAPAADDPRRTELINGQMVAMSPEKVEHNETKANVYLALRSAIAEAGVAFNAVTDGMTVRIDDYTAYEPDAAVYAGERLPRGSVVIEEPVIVVEVVSPTSAHSDRSAKLVGYFTLSSVQHYLIIDPASQTVEHHTRLGDTVTLRQHQDGQIAFEPQGFAIPVASLFA